MNTIKAITSAVLSVCIICSRIELVCCILGLAALACGMPATATVSPGKLTAVAIVDAVSIYFFTWLRGLVNRETAEEA